MKKFAKYALLTGGIALFVFLLLPFLEPPSLQQTATQEGQKASSTQIFTSNPLTDIVGRIARFFTGKSKAQPRSAAAAGQLVQSGTNQAFSDNSVDTALYAAGYEGNPPQEPAPAPAAGQNPDEANAEYFMQNEEGDWVLIRQRTPETSQSGIHEISVKENPYDRLVKQERLARFSPTMRVKQTAEVPESKLASLFKPIKRLFGLETAASSGSLQADGALASARKIGESSGLDRNRAKQAQQFNRAQDVNTAFGNPSFSNLNFNRPPRLTDLVSSPRFAREAAEMVADSLYPDGNTPSSQHAQDWQQAAQDKENEYNQLKIDTMRQDLLSRSGGNTPQDVLPQTGDCDLRKGIVDEGMCPEPTQEELAALQKANRERFEQITHLKLGQNAAALTPILSVADKNSLKKLEPPMDLSNPGAQATTEEEANYQKEMQEKYQKELATYNMYRWMLENSSCDGNCYWVANAQQSEETQKLINGIDAAGIVKFEGDPLKKFDQLKKAFVDAQVAAKTDATEEEKKQIRENAEKASTAYVVYTEQDMAQWSQQIRQAAQQTEGALSDQVMYFSNAADALHFLETNGQDGYNTPVYYGTQNNRVLSGRDGMGVAEHGTLLTDDIIANVETQGKINEKIQKNAAQSTVENVVTPIAEGLNAQLEAEKQNFQNPFGKTEKK